MTVTVSAPATTANLGSGFDCVALALDLWNELEVEPGEFAVRVEGEGADELAIDLSNLAVRAFALAADPAGFRFRLVNRIPLERGLGSSAAAIAAGYAAGCVVAGKPLSDRRAARRGRRARRPRRQSRRGVRRRRVPDLVRRAACSGCGGSRTARRSRPSR